MSLSLSLSLSAFAQTPPPCGDGVVDFPAEQCDDGNTTSCDGCSSTCENECTWTCHADETWVVVPESGGSVEQQVVQAYVRNDSCATCGYGVTVTVPPPLTLVNNTLTPANSVGQLGPGASLNFELTIEGTAGMSGQVLHPFTVRNDGQHRICTHTAKACPIPGEESTLTYSWVTPGATNDLAHLFEGQVAPAGSSFDGRRVKEAFDPSQGSDGCYYGHDEFYPEVTAPVPRTNPWVVGLSTPNTYKWDAIGWRDPAAVLFYRGDPADFDYDLDGVKDTTDTTPICDHYEWITVGCNGDPALPAPTQLTGAASCGLNWHQTMSMRCPNLPGGQEYIDYTSHPTTLTILETEVDASRDSVDAPNLVWP